MRVLFLTLLEFDSLNERNLYCDLLREFVKNGHEVFVISPAERREGISTHIIREDNAVILRLKIGNIQKTNVIEKGISTILLESEYIKAIKKYFSPEKFDLVLYSTPPITLVGAIEYVKKRDRAKTYLLLKDIFPQNAVDIGMMSADGMLYRHFKKQEKRLYAVSDRIGCMSPANVSYLVAHNPDIDPDKVEVCPNSIEPQKSTSGGHDRTAIREKYGIPANKTVLVYGGNLGRPQCIPFIIECLRACRDVEEAFFLIVGDGTEYGKLASYVDDEKPSNVKLMRRLPRDDYDRMIGACDVGLIFLDHRFTIPNFPSRLLGYMQAGLPVLAATDEKTDIGRTITEGGFGWWCESSDSDRFAELVREAVLADPKPLGEKGYRYLVDNYDVNTGYKIIMDSIAK